MYSALCDSFYWPNMHHNLKVTYIPFCAKCAYNKSPTSWPVGPLHPLPSPEDCGDSVAINFIGLLPKEHGFNTIATMTDCARSDIHIVLTWANLTAEHFAML